MVITQPLKQTCYTLVGFAATVSSEPTVPERFSGDVGSKAGTVDD